MNITINIPDYLFTVTKPFTIVWLITIIFAGIGLISFLWWLIKLFPCCSDIQ